MIVFLLEACVGGLAYLYERHIADELVDTMNETFLTSYAVDATKTKAIDAMQQDVSLCTWAFQIILFIQNFPQYTCCGAIRYEDWRKSVWLQSDRADLLVPANNRLVPDSCCISMTNNCGRRDHPSNIPYTV